MSTQFTLHQDGDKLVEIDERSATYCLDLCGYPEDPKAIGDDMTYVSGPQYMSAEETLQMAATIMYAVWCHHPDKANAMAAALADDIPNGACKT